VGVARIFVVFGFGGCGGVCVLGWSGGVGGDGGFFVINAFFGGLGLVVGLFLGFILSWGLCYPGVFLFLGFF
jgi:hypothetical protein